MSSKNNNFDKMEWLIPVVIEKHGNNDLYVYFPDFPEIAGFWIEEINDEFIKDRLMNAMYRYDFPKINNIIKMNDNFNEDYIIKFYKIRKIELDEKFKNNEVKITVEIPSYLNDLIKNKNINLDRLMVKSLLNYLDI